MSIYRLKEMCGLVKLKINNEDIEVKAGTTILEAAKQLGYKIPTLCFMKKLSPYGGCRLCLVEVTGRKDLPISCAEHVEEGMEVYTHSSLLIETRQDIFQLIIANHPFDCKLNCLTCSRIGSCELNELAQEIGIKDFKYEFIEKEWDVDESSLSIVRENSKCISCARCVRTCDEIQHVGVLTMSERGPQTKISTFMDVGMGNIDCTNCGQCIISCPTGAIHEVYHINQVISELKNPNKHVVFQTAPSVRITIGEMFGHEPSVSLEKKIVAALKKIGADAVFDTNFTADLTIMEEGSELIERIKNGGKLPLITSCSPGWIKFAENHFVDCLENLSTCKSPQQMFGALSKTYYAEKKGIEPEKITSVSIMPCTAKKFEMARDELKGDVDFVLTTRELATLIEVHGIDFLKLEDQEYDEPFGISTGAAVIFGTTGGVMEAALRTAYELLTEKELGNINFINVRGLEGIKEAEIEIEDMTIRVAVAHGLENAYKLLQEKDKYHFIEIMACPGGCIGGGGQPISRDEDILRKRMSVVYATDKKQIYRKSHENPAIKKIYEEFLEHPLSHKSHELLHTTYIDRNKDY